VGVRPPFWFFSRDASEVLRVTGQDLCGAPFRMRRERRDGSGPAAGGTRQL
jgi:hypothetical protein